MRRDKKAQKILFCLKDDGCSWFAEVDEGFGESRKNASGESNKDIMVFSSRSLTHEEAIELFRRAHRALFKRYETNAKGHH